MKKLALSLSLLAAGVGIQSFALASPTGLGIFLGGGMDYLSAAKLDTTQTVVTTVGSYLYSPTITYSQGAATGYTGRGAVSYYFYRDHSASYSFGLEAGYNYFSPVKSSVNNALNFPDIAVSFPTNTQETTNAWATDLDLVYTQDLFIPHTSLLLKLGAGYESMTSHLTNVVTNLPGVLDNATINNSGFGVSGGVGVQYNFTKHVGLRLEADGMKGGKNVGYAQGLLGLAFNF